jgi:hypothetical protein
MSIKRYWKYNQLRIQKSFLPLFWTSIIYFFPFIIQNHIFYEPTLWRSNGSLPEISTIDLGRVYLDDWMSFFSLEFDIFDKTQHVIYTGYINILISIIFLIISSIVLYTRINKSKINFYYLAVTFSFLTNPFFLESFQHKTGCLYILPITAIAIISASINTKNKFFDIVVPAVLLYFSLCVYQVGFNIFPAAMILIFLFDFQKQPKEAFTNLIINISKIAIATIFYKLFILNQIKEGSFYTNNTQLFTIDSDFLGNCIENFISIFKISLFTLTESRFFIIFAFIGLISFSMHYISNHKKKILASFVLVFSICSLMFLCCGFSVFFKDAISEARMYGVVGILFILIFHSFYISAKTYLPSLKFIIIIPLLYFTIIAHSCAAMQESQYILCQRVSIAIINKLEEFGFKDGDKVAFTGTIDDSHVSLNSINQNKILKRLYFSNLQGSWFSFLFARNFGAEFQFVDFDNNNGQKNCYKHKSIYKSQHFKIARDQDENQFIVAFKNGSCFKDFN